MDIMIDLETLGTSSQPPLLQIAAVAFDPNGTDLGESFNVHVDPQSCIDLGTRIEWATINWWLAQSDEARGRITKTTNRARIEVAINDLFAFMRRVGVGKVWSHGATFDVPIISAYARRLMVPEPWRFYNARDTRTLFDLYGSDPCKSIVMDGPAHDALVDAKKQALGVQKAWQQVRLNSLGNKFAGSSQGA